MRSTSLGPRTLDVARASHPPTAVPPCASRAPGPEPVQKGYRRDASGTPLRAHVKCVYRICSVFRYAYVGVRCATVHRRASLCTVSLSECVSSCSCSSVVRLSLSSVYFIFLAKVVY